MLGFRSISLGWLNDQVNYGTVPADHVYSSADWSPSELLREKQNWYCHLGIEILENLRVDAIEYS